MKKIYDIIENGINYTVFESNDDCYYKNIILNDFWYKVPKKYHKSNNIKIIINSKYNYSTKYYHNMKLHNIYGPAELVRNYSTGWYVNRYYINGELQLDYDKYLKICNIKIRRKKLSKISKINNN